MTYYSSLRDPRCDNDDCEADGEGGWIHVDECDALSLPLPKPSTDPKDYPAGSFGHWLLGGGA